MKTCGICDKELDGGAVVHRACLTACKADYDKINHKLLEENSRLRAENEELRAELNKNK